MLLGFSQPDEHAHAPDEWIDLDNYETGIRAFVRTFDEIVGSDQRTQSRTRGSLRICDGPGGCSELTAAHHGSPQPPGGPTA